MTPLVPEDKEENNTSFLSCWARIKLRADTERVVLTLSPTCRCDVNGSMTVSKTVRLGSNPSTCAKLSENSS